MDRAIMRLVKHKVGSPSLASMSDHMTRHKPTPNADPAKAPLNRTWAPGTGWVGWADAPPSQGSATRALGEHLAGFEARGGRVQKNAVAVVELMLTASPEMFASPGFDLDGWAAAQIEWGAKIFGRENLLEAVLHLDESTPHIHLLAVPERQKAETRGRRPKGADKSGPLKPCLAANDILGTREKLSDLQTDYAVDMARFGLTRGVRRSRSTHTTIREWYGQLEGKAAELEALRAEVPPLRAKASRVPRLEQQAARLKAMEGDLRTMEILREHDPVGFAAVVEHAEIVLQRVIEQDVERLEKPDEPQAFDFKFD